MRQNIRAALIAATAAVSLSAASAACGAVLVNGLGGPSGFGETYLPPNDDSSTAAMIAATSTISRSITRIVRRIERPRPPWLRGGGCHVRGPGRSRGSPGGRSESRVKTVVTLPDLEQWVRQTLQEESRIRQLASKQHGVFSNAPAGQADDTPAEMLSGPPAGTQLAETAGSARGRARWPPPSSPQVMVLRSAAVKNRRQG